MSSLGILQPSVKPGGFSQPFAQSALGASPLFSQINNSILAKVQGFGPGANSSAATTTQANIRPATAEQIPSLAWSKAAYLAAHPEDPIGANYASWAKQQEAAYVQQQTNAATLQSNLANALAQGQAQLAATKAGLQTQAQKEAAGSQYTNDIGNILAGRNNFANAVNAQQDVVQQAALGGWTGTAGALAGQQKAAQLGATDVLQDRTAKAQDIFATNSAISQRTQQALAADFALNEQDFNRQLGYNQQILASANQALQYATGEQKIRIQEAMNQYNNALAQYQNSAGADKLSDEKGWSIAKAVLGGVVAIGSAVGAVFTGGATLPGVGAGIAIATS